MYTNGTYKKIMNEYSVRSNSNRVHVKQSGVVGFSSEAADAEADKKFSGGYNISKSNICESCFITKYANGSCNC